MADGDLGEGTRLAAATGAWICFEDEAGQALKPDKARTWARRRHTPVIRVSGNSGRLSVAGMACPEGRPARPALLPPARPPQAQGRAPQPRRSRLRRADRRRAPHPGRAPHRGQGQPEHPPQPGNASLYRKTRRLADRGAPARLRPRPQRRRGRLGIDEKRPGQPRRHPLRRPGDPSPQPAPLHPASARPHQRLPRPDRPKPATRSHRRPRPFNPCRSAILPVVVPGSGAPSGPSAEGVASTLIMSF